MHLNALGYIGLRTKNLEDWTAYASRFLGMQLVDKSRGTASLPHGRQEAARWWSTTDAMKRPASTAGRWRTPPRSTPTRRNLESHKVSFARGSRALAEERKVRDLIVLHDPAGNRLEIFHGAETTTDPFKPGRAISGFRTGPLGMGHAVLHCEKIDDIVPFYPRHPGLQAQRLLPQAVRGLFLPRQSAPPQRRLHRVRQDRHPSSDGRRPAISTTSARATTSRCASRR